MNDDPTRTTSEARRGRGRPRDLLKREAILDAATTLFYERGIGATTMEAVAERASVSKMTVYSHFPDKAALLKASFERNISYNLANTTQPYDAFLAAYLEKRARLG